MLVMVVDALGWELASATPGFAAALTHRRRLETVLGFSSGALPTLFTGRMPCEHGRFLMYRRRVSGASAAERAPSTASPFRGFQGLAALPRHLRQSGTLTRALTRWVRRRGVRGYFNLYEIPRPLLAEFDLPERDDPFSPGGLPLPSLWDTLAQSGVSWAGRNWRTPEAENLQWLERELERERPEAPRPSARGSRGVAANDRGADPPALLFFYTADLDARLHVEGSRGAGVGAALARYDAWIARRLASARARGEELWIYLVSDHGMVDVTACEDLMARLAPLEVRWPRDYLAFFDSTLARFWWRTPPARAAIRDALSGAPGHWLAEDELARGGVLFRDHAYGDDLFLLDPGVLMVPSFMGRSPLKAMHGYDPSHPSMAALLWSNRPVPERVSHLCDVKGFLESELAALRQVAA